jgi:two-component system KDP operon response regulator KdpE
MSEQASAPSPQVLLVEDDPQVVKFVRAALEAAGYRVLHAATGRQALSLVAQYMPELVLLDLGLPDLDGLQLLAQIRPFYKAPVLVLSARGQERSKVDALDAGADDYLTKPFGVPELLARLRVALRHAARAASRSDDPRFECGPLQIDFQARRVTLAGEEVKLTAIEFKLLGVLAREVDKVVTQRQLLTEVWGPKSAEQSHYLRVYMTHIRRKLEPGAPWPRLFVTEAGVGYRLRTPEP